MSNQHPNRLATNSAYRLNPIQCPHCHVTGNLDGGDEDYEARSIAQHVTCNNCGYEWDEIYELTHYENMTDAHGDPVAHDPAAYSDDDFKHPHPDHYPIYTESDNDLPPGLYLALYNGWRDYVPHSPELLDDMGFNGPVIGPLAYCQTTYGRHIKMVAATGHSLAKFFPPEDHNADEYYDLDVDIEGYVWHDGCDYGDWVLITKE